MDEAEQEKNRKISHFRGQRYKADTEGMKGTYTYF